MQDGKHVILCVDDDQTYLDTTRLVLEANGYVMVEANSAEEGFAVYQKCQPDFIIVDLMMEELDAGVTLVRKLKELGNRAPVYMASSVGSSLSKTVDPATIGVEAVLEKPIRSATLLGVLAAKLKPVEGANSREES